MNSLKSEKGAMAALFREIVLTLGGVFARRRIDNETIEQIARGLESSYLRVRRIHRHKHRPKKCWLSPHPAFTRLLHLPDHKEQSHE